MHLNLVGILVTLFGWPAGILLGNLLANVFWMPLQYIALHVRLSVHHGALHDKLDDILVRLDACPACGHSRSDADLPSVMAANSIASSAMNDKA